MEIEKHIEDDKVAVLISPGYGGGWSTWVSDDKRDFLLFDKGLVALARGGAAADQVTDYIKEKLGEDVYVYMGGWRGIRVEMLPVGTRFCVEEYDGSESLRLIDDLVIIA